jgi:hypothetical protein
MTRNELVEMVGQALMDNHAVGYLVLGKYHASAVLKAIEGAGLCVVPAEATEQQILACLKSSMAIMKLEGVDSLMPNDKQVNPSKVSQEAYRAMIEAGKV